MCQAQFNKFKVLPQKKIQYLEMFLRGNVEAIKTVPGKIKQLNNPKKKIQSFKFAWKKKLDLFQMCLGIRNMRVTQGCNNCARHN